MEKHLIAVDLDGSLLTDNKTISLRTKTALAKMIEMGHHVVIATGRPYRASKAYYKELQLTTPIVNFNGAYVHHPLNEAWGVYHSPLDLDTVHHLIQTCEAYDLLNIMVEIKDDVYIKNPDPKALNAFALGEPKIITGNIKENLHTDPTCMLIHPQEKNVDALLHDLNRFHADTVNQLSWGAPWHMVEIVRPDVNKAAGLKRIAEGFNVPPERIIAFGDEMNDKEMIAFAGRGIAMGNAAPAIKDIAYDVTLTNEEDGIARYLENLFVLA